MIYIYRLLHLGSLDSSNQTKVIAKEPSILCMLTYMFHHVSVWGSTSENQKIDPEPH
jgi:hypothetical protein